MRCSKLAAGATCTYAVLTDRFARSLMMWGVTKKSSEANMYPKIVDHMGGWPIRAIAVGVTSTLVASEKSELKKSLSSPPPCCSHTHTLTHTHTYIHTYYTLPSAPFVMTCALRSFVFARQASSPLGRHLLMESSGTVKSDPKALSSRACAKDATTYTQSRCPLARVSKLELSPNDAPRLQYLSLCAGWNPPLPLTNK